MDSTTARRSDTNGLVDEVKIIRVNRVERTGKHDWAKTSGERVASAARPTQSYAADGDGRETECYGTAHPGDGGGVLYRRSSPGKRDEDPVAAAASDDRAWTCGVEVLRCASRVGRLTTDRVGRRSCDGTAKECRGREMPSSTGRDARRSDDVQTRRQSSGGRRRAT